MVIKIFISLQAQQQQQTSKNFLKGRPLRENCAWWIGDADRSIYGCCLRRPEAPITPSSKRLIMIPNCLRGCVHNSRYGFCNSFITRSNIYDLLSRDTPVTFLIVSKPQSAFHRVFMIENYRISIRYLTYNYRACHLIVGTNKCTNNSPATSSKFHTTSNRRLHYQQVNFEARMYDASNS
jgi:hypothetical protein